MSSATIDIQLCLTAKRPKKFFFWKGKPRFFIGDLDVTSEMSKEEIEEIGEVDDGDEIDFECELECDFSYRKGTSDYFDRGFGNWLPGDPPDLSVESAMFGGKDIYDHVGVSVQETIDEKLMEAGASYEDEGPEYEPDDF